MTAEASNSNTSDHSATTDGSAPPAGRSRWRRAGFVLVAALGLALYFAPLGVARYLEANGLTLSADDGTTFHIHMADASLGWFSPVRFADVQIDDDAGEPLLRAPRIVSQRSLLSLVVNRQRPGRFFIDQPKLSVVVRPDGSNLEDFLRTIRRDDDDGTEILGIGGTITQGILSFADAAGNSLAQVEEINCSGMQQREAKRRIEVELTSVVVSDGERRPIEAAVNWQGPGDGLPFLSGAGTAAIKFAPVPLSALQPQLSRLFPKLTIHSGSLGGSLLIDTDFRNPQAVKAKGEFLCRDVQGETTSAEGQTSTFGWSEESLAFNVDGQFDPQTDALRIDQFGLQSTPLSLTAKGTVSDLAGECLVDVSGDLRYDVDQLVQSMAGDVSDYVRVEGLRTKRFGISGPLANVVDGQQKLDVSRLNVQADVNWDVANIFGVTSEHATIVTRLQQGVLHIDPQDVPVSGGRFRTASEVELVGDDPAALIDAGPALENVRFSEEMCQLWLKFLSPVLADATRINGRFSIQLDQGRFPVHNPQSGQISGILDVQSGELRPGPFAEQIISIVGTIKSLVARKPGGIATDQLLVTMPQQRVGFVMADRRVQHELMQFQVAGAMVQTSGSVGLDESLDLLVEVPLPESWFKNDLLAAALGGEVIRVPVRGTFAHPQFELTAIRELTRRFAAKAAGGLLQQLLDRGN